MEAQHPKTQITVIKNEKKASNLRRTNTSMSMPAPSGEEKTGKRISFIEDSDHPHMEFNAKRSDGDERKMSNLTEN